MALAWRTAMANPKAGASSSISGIANGRSGRWQSAQQPRSSSQLISGKVCACSASWCRTWAMAGGTGFDSAPRNPVGITHVEENCRQQAPSQGDKNGQAKGMIDKAGGSCLEGHSPRKPRDGHRELRIRSRGTNCSSGSKHQALPNTSAPLAVAAVRTKCRSGRFPPGKCSKIVEINLPPWRKQPAPLLNPIQRREPFPGAGPSDTRTAAGTHGSDLEVWRRKSPHQC